MAEPVNAPVLMPPFRSVRSGRFVHLVNTDLTQRPPFSAICGHVIFATLAELGGTVDLRTQCNPCRDLYELRRTDGYLPPRPGYRLPEEHR